MKYSYHNLTAAALAFVGLLLFASCHSDDSAVEDEWTATYVYLQRLDYLTPSPKTFRIDHTSEGLSAGVDMPFVVKTQKATSKDVHVNLELRDAKAPNIGLQLQDKAGHRLTSSQVTIKAGQQSSDTLRIVATNLDALKTNEQKMNLTFDVAITSIETSQTNTHISPRATMNNLAAKIEKGAMQNMRMGIPEENQMLDRTGGSRCREQRC